MTSRLPITRAYKAPTDFDAAVFEDVDLFVHQILAASMAKGIPAIQDRVFRGCRINGPALLLPTRGTSFDDCNFGDPRGDINNLLFQPLGDRATGAVALLNCKFEGCEFSEVGFTGPTTFMESMKAIGTKPRFGTLS
ncbi:hypothetical protein MMB232_00427 [Brevundimonas subvibrioides]|uniref:hypothetical protein n=1 Tax=Brevundimonas subvibrioides TaxID=74313 RepID=UPI0032D58942